jgi:hypothetical protein
MASGDSLLLFHPSNNEPPASSYATPDTRNSRPCLDFDASTTERAVFSAVMPQHYDGSGVTVYLHVAWSSDTNTAHKTRWDVAFELVGDGDLDVDSDDFAAANSASQSVVATSGHVDITTIAFTDGADMDSVAAGDGFRIYVERDHDHADDDASGDAELLWLEIQET